MKSDYYQVNALLFNRHVSFMEPIVSIIGCKLTALAWKSALISIFGVMEKLSSMYSQGLQDSPGKRFISLPRDNGRYKIAILVFDQHDSGHMCARIMGPSLETGVSMVQCMV